MRTDIARGWDREARASAYAQAQALSARDPEAAAVLYAHLEATAATAGAPSPLTRIPTGREGYNPTRVYAQVIRACHWTWRDCDECHFPSFFGLLRELQLLAREEDAAAEARMQSGGGNTWGAPRAGYAGGSGTTVDAELAQVQAHAAFAAHPFGG